MTRAILISRNRVAKCGISRQQQSAFECAYNLQVFCFKVYPDGCVWYARRFFAFVATVMSECIYDYCGNGGGGYMVWHWF